ncbi:hypothetical protein ruthe_00956 [Rubellimicrobium thermophilum DSM 16684]|uniref:Uncharacterized protein n=1 Tax=Rubellimicrobium thermophilum DSM 16684 TaxID=1123069 RepID=S9R2M9_9RHOB|nr:hypothetical protein [Rubellimicrobium thermophilum]EPX86147.1 hypothetical protein ruthe_00956 [Rubellimicrobium thermophilum DSM 16684]
MILVIGNLRSWHAEGRILPEIEGFHFARFEDLSADLLHALKPDLVLSPLMGEDFDALDVAQRLDALGYAGRYRALTNPVPDPDAIRAEMRSVAPDLDFDLFVINDSRS